MSEGSTAPARPVVRRPADLAAEGWDDERGRLSWVTLLSADRTPTDTFTLGLATVPAGGFLARHRHPPAEFYVILAGHGIVALEDAEHEVGSGDTIFVPGGAVHGIRNPGTCALRFLYGFAVDDFTGVAYDFGVPPA